MIKKDYSIKQKTFIFQSLKLILLVPIPSVPLTGKIFELSLVGPVDDIGVIDNLKLLILEAYWVMLLIISTPNTFILLTDHLFSRDLMPMLDIFGGVILSEHII